MALQLHNTLTRRKEPFVPRDPGRVGIYLCGPTVYAEPHIGNLRPVVVFDVLRRHLAASGYEVVFVRNYTDVDDKIINAAGHDPLQAFVVAEHWTRVYDEITAALGVLPPDIAPRASGHLPEMLDLIARLVDAGIAYQAGGDVYFAVGKWPEYGKLSGRDPAELLAGARVEVNPDKRDPLDFALWKGAKPGEPTWDSPWGPGRPGWHIECSAMAGKYLGRGFDIHGGGEDLVFPHHENEIAQSEGATGEPFARYWVHNAFLELKGEKMAKSVGNVVSPRELLGRHRGVVLRYALLGAHYRSPLEFSEEVLADAAASYDRLATFATNAARALSLDGAAGSGARARRPAGPARLAGAVPGSPRRRPQRPRRPGRPVRPGRRGQPPDRPAGAGRHRRGRRAAATASPPSSTWPAASASPRSTTCPTRRPSARCSTSSSTSANERARPATSPPPTPSATAWPPPASGSRTAPAAPDGTSPPRRRPPRGPPRQGFRGPRRQAPPHFGPPRRRGRGPPPPGPVREAPRGLRRPPGQADPPPRPARRGP